MIMNMLASMAAIPGSARAGAAPFVDRYRVDRYRHRRRPVKPQAPEMKNPREKYILSRIVRPPAAERPEFQRKA